MPLIFLFGFLKFIHCVVAVDLKEETTTVYEDWESTHGSYYTITKDVGTQIYGFTQQTPTSSIPSDTAESLICHVTSLPIISNHRKRQQEVEPPLSSTSTQKQVLRKRTCHDSFTSTKEHKVQNNVFPIPSTSTQEQRLQQDKSPVSHRSPKPQRAQKGVRNIRASSPVLLIQQIQESERSFLELTDSSTLPGTLSFQNVEESKRHTADQLACSSDKRVRSSTDSSDAYLSADSSNINSPLRKMNCGRSKVIVRKEQQSR